jgi:hypothetical protein
MRRSIGRAGALEPASESVFIGVQIPPDSRRAGGAAVLSEDSDAPMGRAQLQ